MKNCAGPCTGHEGGCNWLDGMLADGRCPHCGGPVTEITTVTPLGRLMDAMSLAQPGPSSPSLPS